jgi:hypothetical protein
MSRPLDIIRLRQPHGLTSFSYGERQGVRLEQSLNGATVKSTLECRSMLPEQFVRFDAFQSVVSVMSHKRQPRRAIDAPLGQYFTSSANALRLPSGAPTTEVG